MVSSKWTFRILYGITLTAWIAAVTFNENLRETVKSFEYEMLYLSNRSYSQIAHIINAREFPLNFAQTKVYAESQIRSAISFGWFLCAFSSVLFSLQSTSFALFLFHLVISYYFHSSCSKTSVATSFVTLQNLQLSVIGKKMRGRFYP